jgi:Fe-S cluster assembly ATP-binding protein
MLKIQNLQASVQGKQVLCGINLTVNKGEVHAIMGPNGSGKSSFANVLAGKQGYEVIAGSIQFKEQPLLSLTPEERAASGLFLAFQYPIEIPGVNNMYFMKSALNSVRKKRNEATLDAVDFLKLVKEKLKELDMSETFLNRSVNAGFSGGEKKRNEILQMLLLQPNLAILDETDSGLDIDALQTVAKGVNSLRSADNALIIVTHYQRLLNYIIPDFVHVLARGKIIRSGGKELALELEEKGYGWIEEVISREAEAV